MAPHQKGNVNPEQGVVGKISPTASPKRAVVRFGTTPAASVTELCKSAQGVCCVSRSVCGWSTALDETTRHDLFVFV